MSWWEQLDKKRGSRPRAILMMDGDPRAVAERLTSLVNLADVVVSQDDKWMPKGKPEPMSDGSWNKEPLREAKLGNSNDLVPADVQKQL